MTSIPKDASLASFTDNLAIAEGAFSLMYLATTSSGSKNVLGLAGLVTKHMVLVGVAQHKLVLCRLFKAVE